MQKKITRDTKNIGEPAQVMLRQCRAHGHFRGSNCPVCNEEGKFIMSDRESNSLGRILALVLRHAPEKFGVDMDINGWVNTKELSESISIKEDTITGLEAGILKLLPTRMRRVDIKSRVK